MRSTPVLTAIVLALLPFITVGQAHESPRTHVEAVARTIEQDYFDAARGKQVATELRSAAVKGEFDTLVDKRELASALSVRLEPFDRHFRVGWEPPQRSAAPASAPWCRAS